MVAKRKKNKSNKTTIKTPVRYENVYPIWCLTELIEMDNLRLYTALGVRHEKQGIKRRKAK